MNELLFFLLLVWLVIRVEVIHKSMKDLVDQVDKMAGKVDVWYSKLPDPRERGLE